MLTAKTIPIIIACWLGTLTLAFFAGKKQAPSPADAPEGVENSETSLPGGSNSTVRAPIIVKPAPAQKGFGETETIDRSNINQLVDRKRREADGTAFQTANRSADVPTTIREALDDSDPISRMARFTEALQDLGPHNVQQVLEAFKAEGNTGDREFSMFLYAWAKFDGPAAMDYIKQNGRRGWDGMQHSYSAMSGFAAADPAAAEQWANENFEGQDNPYLIGVINGVAKTDLQKATEITQTLPYGRIRGRAVDVLIDGYFKQGAQDAMTWASGLEPGVLKNGIVSRVTGRLSRDDPQLAADFVGTLTEGEERNNASVSLADSWSRSDPQAASQWAANIPDDAARGKALEETVEQWARRDTEGVGTFLEAQPSGAYLDGAIREYAERLRFNDPVESLTWAATISDEDGRHKLMERIAEEWSERDPEAAEAFLNK